MIIELFLIPIFALLDKVIGFLPNGYDLPDWGVHAVNLISKGLIFFPNDVWIVTMSNISFWLIAQMAWAALEWVYKKLPGVD